MKKSVLTLLFLITSFMTIAQHNDIITKDNITQLTKIVDSINNEFQKLIEYPKFKSLEQTTANYLKIKTLKEEEFENKLNTNYSFDKLLEEYNYSVLDRDLLITKTSNSYFSDKEKYFTIQSYEINQNGKHSIRIKYDSLKHSNKQRKYYYKKYYNSKAKSSSFYIWYLHEPFKIYELPVYINKQIAYADAITGKEEVFVKGKGNRFRSNRTLEIYAFEKFFDSVTKKPKREDNIDYNYYEEKRKWEEINDSLYDIQYASNEQVRKKTEEIIKHVLEKNISRTKIDKLIAKYRTKEQALYLKRNYPQWRSGCLSNSGVINLREIAYLASDIPSWSVYIQAHLGLLNWSHFHDWPNNNFKIRKDKATEELTKLPINLNDLLFGIYYKISNPSLFHYKVLNNHLTKTYAFSKNKEKTIKFYEKILRDKKVDPFNKLQIYHMFKKVISFESNNDEKTVLQQRLNNHLDALPSCIKDRVKNNNLEFKNLLGDQKQLFLEHFRMPDRNISFYSSSDTWNGTFKLNNEQLPIYLYIYEDISESFTNVQQLIDIKDEYIRRVKSNDLLHDYLKGNNPIEIKLEKRQSYTEEQYSKHIPESILKKYGKMFDTAISFYSKYKGNTVRWLLFANGDLLLVDKFKGFTLGKYTEDELTSFTYEILGEKFSKAYKIFNKKGILIN